MHFRETALDVRKEDDGEIRERDVDAAVRQLQVLPIHDSGTRVFDARVAQTALKPLDHVGREIDAHYIVAGRRRKHGQNAGTGPDIDDRMSGARLYLRRHLFREQAGIGLEHFFLAGR
ncbi:MAG TPA: hypothetical protein VE224_19570, partial [Pseudolabrys sp.]|nr:hypothetical protein [Pseudolabrys sp.]